MSREASVFQSLTATDRLSDLLPVLHHHAVAAVGGRSSMLFQFARGCDTLQATSAFGVERLPPDPSPAELIPQALFRNGKPRFVADVSRVVRGVHEYLGTLPALLVPLVQMQNPMGLLVIGCEKRPSPQQIGEAVSVGHAFTLALDRARASSEADLQTQLRDLLQAFARDVSSSTLSARLEVFCIGANHLFGGDRISVWMHDRRARMVVLTASSDVVYLAHDRRIPTANSLAPAAVALRRDRAEIAATGLTQEGVHTAMVTVPLKGRRRALGTLVMDEVRFEPGAQMDLLERADEMGRQLAAAIENVVLLDAVLQSRRELENTFNSLTDLVAVSDHDGRLVSMNAAFVERTGMTRQELIDRPIADTVGPATRELIRAAVTAAAPEVTAASAEVEDPVLRGTFAVTLTPLVGEQRESIGVVLVARDVTPQA
ncbi:MAG: PAS domain-containing protein, partial [Vicinamibacterales bacterium]